MRTSMYYNIRTYTYTTIPSLYRLRRRTLIPILLFTIKYIMYIYVHHSPALFCLSISLILLSSILFGHRLSWLTEKVGESGSAWLYKVMYEKILSSIYIGK